MYYPYNLVFTETDFNGSLCNSYQSDYTYDEINLTLTVIELYQTFGSCAGSGGATEDYETGLFYEILSTNNGNPTTLDYEITGTGTNETLKLTNANGNFAVYGRQLLSTNSFETDYKISMFPNPVKDILTINTKIDLNNCFLFNINGRLINNYHIDKSHKIDVSNLNSGIYFIKFISDGKEIATGKIIKL